MCGEAWVGSRCLLGLMFQLYGFYSIVIEEGLTSSKHLAPRHQRYSWTRCIVIALIWAADSNLCPPNIQVLNRAFLNQEWRNGASGCRAQGFKTYEFKVSNC